MLGRLKKEKRKRVIVKGRRKKEEKQARKMGSSEEKVSGVTINLLVDKDGNKIGKTQGKPI